MIVVMIISTIIVSMSFVVFSKIDQLSVSLRKLYQANYQLALLDKLIYSDIEQAEKIIKTEEGFACILKNEIRHYHISDVIIRTQETQVDTFGFINKMNINYQYTNDKNVLIKGMTLQGEYDEENMNLVYHKEYGADILVNDYE